MSVLSLRGMPRTLTTSGVAARKGIRALRREGLTTTAQRVARYTYTKLGAGALEAPLRANQIADSAHVNLHVPEQRPSRGRPLTIGWVTTPPALGSGGHTTMFRMISALEAAGHRCVLYLFDRFDGELNDHLRVIREGWPTIRAEVQDATHGMDGLDAAVATGWETAHILALHGTSPMRHLYFIQDFEPFFYPRGFEYSLAEDTYRFGFRCIALGQMVARVVETEVGTHADVTSFGCDTEIYHLSSPGQRDGVVFYARPGVARRGYTLAQMGLEAFHARCPQVPIHSYGAGGEQLPFPVVHHGRLTPPALNDLYNRCITGLAMSFTNISLVAEEMLAAGTIPVVNDASEARADLRNHFVEWARPTPQGIADALSRAVAYHDISARASGAAGSVRHGWSVAQADVLRIIEEEVYGT